MPLPDPHEVEALLMTSAATAANGSQQLGSALVETAAVQRNPSDYFADPPPTPHVNALRPWPEVSGSRRDLDRALTHMLGLAEVNNIRLQYTEDRNFTDIGLDRRATTQPSEIGTR